MGRFTKSEKVSFCIWVGNKLRFARENAGLKQIEVATALSLSQSEISKFENGHKPPDFILLSEFAQLYKVEFKNLLPHAIWLQR